MQAKQQQRQRRPQGRRRHLCWRALLAQVQAQGPCRASAAAGVKQLLALALKRELQLNLERLAAADVQVTARRAAVRGTHPHCRLCTLSLAARACLSLPPLRMPVLAQEEGQEKQTSHRRCCPGPGQNHRRAAQTQSRRAPALLLLPPEERALPSLPVLLLSPLLLPRLELSSAAGAAAVLRQHRW